MMKFRSWVGMLATSAVVFAPMSAYALPEPDPPMPIDPSEGRYFPDAIPDDVEVPDREPDPAPAQDPTPTPTPTPDQPPAPVDGQVPVEPIPTDPELQPEVEQEPARPTTGIIGTIRDASTGEPLADVLIEVVGNPDEVGVTDAKGRYDLRLKPGTYTIRIAGELHQRHRVRGIVVRRGVTQVDIKLSAEAVEEVVVVAPPDTATEATQVVRRRKRATVSDAISAEQISRSPDSSASDAAKRMVGATIQDGRYVVIRGLGGRYSLTLLNGVPLPSPDPDVPAAPLDLFPAALLANLTVTKTFSPDTPANFAGGALSIETRSFPSKFTLKLRTGISGNSQSSFQELNGYRGGSYDALGYDDGTRALPSIIPRYDLAGDPSLPVDQQNEQMTSFDNNWELEPVTGIPGGSLGVTIGDTHSIRKQKVGYFASVNYGHSYSRRISHVSKVGEDDGMGGQLPSTLQLNDDSGTRSASLGGLVTGGWTPSAAHNVNFIGLYTHNADISASRITGIDDNTTQIERTRMRFLERQMQFAQVIGEHGLLGGRLVLGWQGNLSHVAQDEPDTRDLVRTLGDDGRWVINTGSGSSERLFSDLADNGGGGGVDVTVPFEPVKFKLGGSFLRSDRYYYARRFHFVVGSEHIFDEPNQAFAPENASAMLFYESTLPSDGYLAKRDIGSAYMMADVVHWDPLRIVAGARFEQSTLDIGLDSRVDLMLEEEPPTRRVDEDILPSINAVYGLTKAMNLRAAYGMTVARPNFREVAPALYYDYVRRRAIGGNPDLVETKIHNADVRWESFIGDTELVAASLFYKKFQHPIEQTVENAGSGTNVSFANADGARSYGVELEARVSAGRFTPALAEVSVGANLALIGSKIELTGAERPLQGQSPYVANLDLSYDHARTGTQASLLFNSFGRRIEEVGTGGLGNVYEEPFHRLDLTVSQKLPRDLKLKLAAANLLNQRVVRTQDGVEIYGYDAGFTVAGSLELSVD
jgi:outer membrane receptor protein involved in Fe transport